MTRGLSMATPDFSTWDAFLRATETTVAIDGALRRGLELRYADMSLSESAWRDLA
jgi:hypothetical protein